MKRRFCLLLIVLIIFPAIGYGEESLDQDKGLDKNTGETAGMIESIAKILDALAWPLVILIVVILLRKKVLDRLDSFTYKGATAKFFKEALKQGERQLSESMELNEISFDSLMKDSHLNDPFISLMKKDRLNDTMEYKYIMWIAQFSTQGTIAATWYHMENAIVSLAMAAGVDGAESEKPYNSLSTLISKKILSANNIKLIRTLSLLKANLDATIDLAATDVVPDPIISGDDLETYIMATLRVTARLKLLEERVRNNS